MIELEKEVTRLQNALENASAPGKVCIIIIDGKNARYLHINIVFSYICMVLFAVSLT